MPTLRIFASFEYDRDRRLRDEFFGQANDRSPHRVVNSSLREAGPENQWQQLARERIEECDIVVILVGQDTHNASGVRSEVKIARRVGRPIIQVVPRGENYTGVTSVKRPIPWDWDRINQAIETAWNRKQRASST